MAKLRDLTITLALATACSVVALADGYYFISSIFAALTIGGLVMAAWVLNKAS